jgi:hypothetical protein
MISGLMIRDNSVTALQTIYSADGSNGINANVIEKNEANWWVEPWYDVPGFLVLNNVPQRKRSKFPS